MIKIFLIFLLGLLIRVAANNRDFWFDEAYTYQIANLPLKELTAATLTDNNPPFYYLLIHFILKISQNETIIRLPSLVASLISIFVVYKLGQKITHQRTALLAATLFVISPLTIYLSTEARPHSLAILATMLTIYYFFNLITKPKTANFVQFGAIFTLGLYTHYYLALLVLPLTWLFLKNKRPFFKTWLLTTSASLAILIPWLIISAKYQHAACYCPQTITALPLTLISPVVNLVGPFTPSDLANLPPAIFLFASTSAAAVIFLVRGLTISPLKLVYLIPLVILSIPGLFWGIFSPKAFAIFSPVYLIITAQAISQRPQQAAIFVLLVSTVTLIQIFDPSFHQEKLKLTYVSTYQNNPLPTYHTSILSYYSFCFYAATCTSQVLLGQNPLSDQTISLIGGRPELFSFPQTNFWLIDTPKWTNENQRGNQLSLIFSSYSALETRNFGNISTSLMQQR